MSQDEKINDHMDQVEKINDERDIRIWDILSKNESKKDLEICQLKKEIENLRDELAIRNELREIKEEIKGIKRD